MIITITNSLSAFFAKTRIPAWWRARQLNDLRTYQHPSWSALSPEHISHIRRIRENVVSRMRDTTFSASDIKIWCDINESIYRELTAIPFITPISAPNPGTHAPAFLLAFNDAPAGASLRAYRHDVEVRTFDCGQLEHVSSYDDCPQVVQRVVDVIKYNAITELVATASRSTLRIGSGVLPLWTEVMSAAVVIGSETRRGIGNVVITTPRLAHALRPHAHQRVTLVDTLHPAFHAAVGDSVLVLYHSRTIPMDAAAIVAGQYFAIPLSDGRVECCIGTASRDVDSNGLPLNYSPYAHLITATTA